MGKENFSLYEEFPNSLKKILKQEEMNTMNAQPLLEETDYSNFTKKYKSNIELMKQNGELKEIHEKYLKLYFNIEKKSLEEIEKNNNQIQKVMEDTQTKIKDQKNEQNEQIKYIESQKQTNKINYQNSNQEFDDKNKNYRNFTPEGERAEKQVDLTQEFLIMEYQNTFLKGLFIGNDENSILTQLNENLVCIELLNKEKALKNNQTEETFDREEESKKYSNIINKFGVSGGVGVGIPGVFSISVAGQKKNETDKVNASHKIKSYYEKFAQANIRSVKYSIQADSIKLTPNARNHLLAINATRKTSPFNAKRDMLAFFDKFGTHYNAGSYVFGGSFTFRIITTGIEESNKEMFDKMAATAIETSIGGIIKCLSIGVSAKYDDISQKSTTQEFKQKQFNVTIKYDHHGGDSSCTDVFLWKKSINESNTKLVIVETEFKFVSIAELITNRENNKYFEDLVEFSDFITECLPKKLNKTYETRLSSDHYFNLSILPILETIMIQNKSNFQSIIFELAELQKQYIKIQDLALWSQNVLTNKTFKYELINFLQNSQFLENPIKEKLKKIFFIIPESYTKNEKSLVFRRLDKQIASKIDSIILLLEAMEIKKSTLSNFEIFDLFNNFHKNCLNKFENDFVLFLVELFDYKLSDVDIEEFTHLIHSHIQKPHYMFEECNKNYYRAFVVLLLNDKTKIKKIFENFAQNKDFADLIKKIKTVGELMKELENKMYQNYFKQKGNLDEDFFISNIIINEDKRMMKDPDVYEIKAPLTQEKPKNFTQMFLDSEIIDDDEMNLFLKKLFPELKKSILLFSGGNANEFHQKCNYKKNTLLVLQVGDEIAGGFNPIGWEGDTLFQSEKAFLFSLTKKKKYLIKQQKTQFAFDNHPNDGPIFGYNPKEIKFCPKCSCYLHDLRVVLPKGICHSFLVNYGNGDEISIFNNSCFRYDQIEVFELFFK